MDYKTNSLRKLLWAEGVNKMSIRTQPKHTNLSQIGEADTRSKPKITAGVSRYVEDYFWCSDEVDARIFAKGELDEETGLYYYGARYLDPKYSRWLSGDPALGEYIPVAPTNDEAREHNENLPGMGGVFNVVNLHLYHYAGNNPVKYVDPDGEDIHHIELLNVGTRLIVGGDATIGFAYDDNGDVALFVSINAGIGVEGSVTPDFLKNIPLGDKLSPGINVSKGKNMSDLFGGFGFRFDGDIDFIKGLSVKGGALLAFTMDLQEPSISGVSVMFGAGGGVDYISGTMYINLTEIEKGVFGKINKAIDGLNLETLPDNLQLLKSLLDKALEQ